MVQKEMVGVYPIRYNGNDLEFLLVKRATVGYNWQCVTGSVGQSMGVLDHPKGESPLECAKRELYEETGYIPALIFPLDIPKEYYVEYEGDDGEQSPLHLKEGIKEIRFHNFIALIDQTQDPVLDPDEHTDWRWCSFETGYEIIRYAVEKKLLNYVHKYLVNNPIKY